MSRRRIKKSLLIPLVFTIYSAVMYAYFIPRSDAGLTKILTTIGVNILIIVALWYLYRRKEQMAERRNKDMMDNDIMKK